MAKFIKHPMTGDYVNFDLVREVSKGRRNIQEDYFKIMIEIDDYSSEWKTFSKRWKRNLYFWYFCKIKL